MGVKFINRYENWIALVVGLLLVLAVYTEVFLAPNSYLFSGMGDGIKNYFSVLFNLKHESNIWYTRSMNYPYGELLLFTDGQPLLALSFRLLVAVFPFLSDHGVGYMNLWMLASLVFGYFFSFKVLRQLGLPFVASLLFGIGIFSLQPQIFRLAGHYGLSYACVIPMAIYLLLSIKARWSVFKYVILLLSAFLTFFLHPYLGLIFSVCILFFAFVSLITGYLSKRVTLSLLVGTVAMVFSYLLIVNLTDNHSGRTPSPFGFFYYRAQLKTLLVPHHPPLKPLIQQVAKIGGQQWEGWAYFGLVGVLGILLLFWRWIRRFRTSLRRTRTAQHSLLMLGLLSALFAMAIPFTLGLEFLIEYIGPLKQFRSLGRFAWISFYAFNFVVAWKLYAFYRFNRKKHKGVLASLFIVVPLLLMLWESWPYHQDMRYTITQSRNSFLEEGPNFSAQDYSAVMGIPTQIHGSENFNIPGDPGTNAQVFLTSYKTGLSVFGGSSGRSSIHEARKQLQALGPDFYPKEIKNDLPAGKILLVKNKDWPMNAYERNIWSKAQYLFRNEGFWDYASISVSDLLAFDPWKIEEASGRSSLVDLRTFDQDSSAVIMTGEGAKSGTKNKYLQIANYGPEIKPGKYVLTSWVYTKGFSMPQMSVFIEARYKDEDQLIRLSEVNPGHSPVILGDWSMIEMHFHVEKELELMNLVAKGGRFTKQPFYFDNLMLRPEGEEVIVRLDEDHFIANGYIIPVN